MLDSPLVSIIIPYYSHADYLPECVDSALGQTYKHVEAVVVDDASPGRSAADVLSSYKNDNLKIVHHETNKGVSAARNTGVAAASGSLILPLDSDDFLDPTYLEKTVPHLSNEKLGGVYTAVKTVGDEDSIYGPEWTMSGILTGSAGALVCMLYRKSMFEQLGGYDTRWRVGEDSDFFLRALKVGWQFQRVEEALYFYRKHSGGTTSARPTRDLNEMTNNLLQYHHDLMAEHVDEVVKFKEERFWKLFDEYKHLHSEFHKLLELYNNLEKGVRNGNREPGLAARLKARLDRTFKP